EVRLEHNDELAVGDEFEVDRLSAALALFLLNGADRQGKRRSDRAPEEKIDGDASGGLIDQFRGLRGSWAGWDEGSREFDGWPVGNDDALMNQFLVEQVAGLLLACW